MFDTCCGAMLQVRVSAILDWGSDDLTRIYVICLPGARKNCCGTTVGGMPLGHNDYILMRITLAGRRRPAGRSGR